MNLKYKLQNFYIKKKKYEFNKDILDQINRKEFNQAAFVKIGNDEIKKIRLNSIKDVSKFEVNSVEILYSLPVNTFTLVYDEKDNIFIAKVTSYEDVNISQNTIDFNAISNKTSAENRNGILKSYDYLLNNKYEVIVNEKTLERVKNYFR